MSIRIAFLAVLVGVCGCSRAKGPVTITVAGKVALDGTPVAQGDILFEPQDGKGAATSAVIKSGRFSAHVEPGPKIVRIHAPKLLGKVKAYPNDPDSSMIEQVEEQAPPQYNAKSTLQRDLRTAANDIDFELSTRNSPPKPRS